MKPIPIEAAKQISEKYEFDQVIIVARRVGEGGGESVTTYGKDKAHCDVAAQCGDFLKYEVMKWHDACTESESSIDILKAQRDKLCELVLDLKECEQDSDDEEKAYTELLEYALLLTGRTDS